MGGNASSQMREEEILRRGQEIQSAIEGETPGVFDKDYWQGRLMEWVLKDPSVKVDLFRFVDVLPSLQTHEQIAEHIKEYLLKGDRSLPALLGTAFKAATMPLTGGIASKAIRANVSEMAEKFIVGHDAASARRVLLDLYKQGIGFTVDLLGESTLSYQEAGLYQQQYLRLIEELAKETRDWQKNNVLTENHLGAIPITNVSIKMTAMDPQLRACDPDGAVERLKRQILPLFLKAKEVGAFINLDLEQWEMHEIAYRLFEELLMHPKLRGYPHLGIVVQAYLLEAHKDVGRLLALAKNRNTPLTVRLVKGAYWDYEVIRSKQIGTPCPVFTDKSATDANYEELTERLLDNIDWIMPAFGSHNLRSVMHAIVAAEEKRIPKKAIEIQMLYGMAEPERIAFMKNGYRVRVYAPIGKMLPGMAYLVRRLLENTSNQGFLRLHHHNQVDIKTLLQAPVAKEGALPAHQDEFENVPLLDFSNSDVRLKYMDAIEKCRRQLPYQIPVVVDGTKQTSGNIVTHACPSDHAKIATKFYAATRENCQNAIDVAFKNYPRMRDKPLEERSHLLKKLANLLERDRFHLAAMQTLEVAKPWAEADADVAEAIDFCNYYADHAVAELAPRQQGRVLGESNIVTYEGRGPTVVISPWNFPLAICTGMTIAALVGGNPVLIKPAEQSTAIAYALYERLIEAGFSTKDVQFLPGVGEEIGPFLVEHPLVAQVVFTGSKQVGQDIYRRISRVHPNQMQMKRMVCEMGGKNAIIIDDDADLDEAVAGVIHSAFGFSGQKCSACSRVIVVGTAYDMFVKRLIEACRGIIVDKADSPSCSMGPVIDEKSYQRLLRVIEEARQKHEALYIGEARSDGYFVPIGVFAVKDAGVMLMQEEFFGPVLAVMQVASMEKALEIATNTEFALTGAVYSRSPSHLELARARFRVGNLYLNRPSTGAMVHRQPFGGFKMSGLGTKAGGPGYLLQFVESRCVTENTMRRGFSPDLEN